MGLIIWWTVVIALPRSMTADGQLAGVAHFLAGEVFLTAGVVGLALWRIQRRVEALHSSLGFIALGMALPALELLTPWTADDVTVAPTAVVLRCAVLIPIFALLSRPTAISSVARRTSPRTAAVVVGAPVLSAALLAEVIAETYSPAAAQRTVAAGVELTAMLCWILLGQQRRRMPLPGSGDWAAVAMYLMAATEFLNLVGLTGVLPPIGLNSGVQLAAAVVIALLFAGQLRDAYRDQRVQADSISDALAQTSQLLMRLEQVHRERLHDARSAVFGVINASELLAAPRPGSDLDASTLQRMIAAELIRLQDMLDTDVSEPISDFDLDEVLSPVLLAHRIDGARLRVEGLEGRAHGRPRATATVLDNLLRNARTHAPGAAISVTVEHSGDDVTITVDDDGPGIAESERMAVLLPGVRGSAAQGRGSGLGLHSCLAAMNAQDGALSLGESATGGLRVMLRFPAGARTSELLAS